MLMFIVWSSWQGYCDSSPGSFDECRLSAKWLLTLRLIWPTCAVSLTLPSPFIIINQPEGWYSFYRPAKGRRLSRPM